MKSDDNNSKLQNFTKSCLPWITSAVSFVLVFLFSGCGKSNKSTHTVSQTSFVKLAKQQGIPIPVGYTLMESKIQEDTTEDHKNTYRYTGPLSVLQGIGFYKRTMELTGWDIQDFSTTGKAIAPEGLLVCSKAHKQCVITIRSQTSKHDANTIIGIVKKVSSNETKNKHKLLSNLNRPGGASPPAKNFDNADFSVDTINKKVINISRANLISKKVDLINS